MATPEHRERDDHAGDDSHGLGVVSALGEDEEHDGDEQEEQRDDVALDPRLQVGGVPGGARERNELVHGVPLIERQRPEGPLLPVRQTATPLVQGEVRSLRTPELHRRPHEQCRTGGRGSRSVRLAPPLPIIRARRNASRAPTASLRDGLRPPLTQPARPSRCSAMRNQPQWCVRLPPLMHTPLAGWSMAASLNRCACRPTGCGASSTWAGLAPELRNSVASAAPQRPRRRRISSSKRIGSPEPGAIGNEGLDECPQGPRPPTAQQDRWRRPCGMLRINCDPISTRVQTRRPRPHLP